jgi:tRNA pseudouridine13 synthase
VVEEELGFEPSGSGEHCWLWVEKENLNTSDAAQRLARFAGLRVRDISYAGRKDRGAVTRQWFSLHLLNRAVDWARWSDPALRLLRVARHHRKLRRGAHRGNYFRLVLRDVRGDADAFVARLALVGAEGVPNYFGPQRFGRDGRNLEAMQRWLDRDRPRLSRDQQSLYLSSARAFLFNQVLAARVAAANWRAPLAGEVFILDGSASVFQQAPDAALQERLAAGDVHLSGPLPGRAAGLVPAAAVAALEAAGLAPHAALAAALDSAGVEAARRSLRVLPTAWRCEPCGEADWRLEFRLPKGCFATSVVRELARTDRSPAGDGISSQE